MHNVICYYRNANQWVPGWLIWLNIQLLIWAQVMILGLWRSALSLALRWAWNLLESLSPSLPKTNKKTPNPNQNEILLHTH